MADDYQVEAIEDSTKIDLSAFTDPLLANAQYLYSNHVVISFTKWDMRIVFADIVGKANVTPRVGVILTYAMAKRLQATINRAVEGLESKIGAIRDQGDELLPKQAGQPEEPASEKS